MTSFFRAKSPTSPHFQSYDHRMLLHNPTHIRIAKRHWLIVLQCLLGIEWAAEILYSSPRAPHKFVSCKGGPCHKSCGGAGLGVSEASAPCPAVAIVNRCGRELCTEWHTNLQGLRHTEGTETSVTGWGGAYPGLSSPAASLGRLGFNVCCWNHGID